MSKHKKRKFPLWKFSVVVCSGLILFSGNPVHAQPEHKIGHHIETKERLSPVRDRTPIFGGSTVSDSPAFSVDGFTRLIIDYNVDTTFAVNRDYVSKLTQYSEQQIQEKQKQERKAARVAAEASEQVTLQKISAALPDTINAGQSIVDGAASLIGHKYVWGGAGPDVFDCSGLTAYVYLMVANIYLPHSAQGQTNYTTQVDQADVQPGDLVFFHNKDRVYHVGIYAGDNMMWDAPHTGALVREEPIWSPDVTYGRVNGLKITGK